jgi:hypothetical protein
VGPKPRALFGKNERDCEPVHICSGWRLLACYRWGFQGPVIGAAGTRHFEPDGVAFCDLACRTQPGLIANWECILVSLGIVENNGPRTSHFNCNHSRIRGGPLVCEIGRLSWRPLSFFVRVSGKSLHSSLVSLTFCRSEKRVQIVLQVRVAIG